MVNVTEQKLGRNYRKSFSKTRTTKELPNLVEVQTNSYKWFMEKGLEEVLHEVSPITDFSGNYQIEFLRCRFDDEARYPIDDCKERDVNYAKKLYVETRFTNKLTGEIKDDQVYMGDFPIMTETGTFVINGAERVIVSQIVRSPGMYFTKPEKDKTGKFIYAGQVIPYRGAWLEYDIDSANVMWVRIDKTRKLPVSVFLRALGLGEDEDILSVIGEGEIIKTTMSKDECHALAAANRSNCNEEALKEIYKRLRPGEPPTVDSATTLIHNLFFDPHRYDIAPVGRYKFNKKVMLRERIADRVLAEDVFSDLTGEVLFEKGTKLSMEDALTIERACVNSVTVVNDHGEPVTVISNQTLEPEYFFGFDLKEAGVRERAFIPVMQEIKDWADTQEFDSDEARQKAIVFEAKTRIGDLCPRFITKADIYASVNYMLGLTKGIGTYDDIDHLGNRRVRSVGEQLQNQIRIGFSRMDKIIKERMTIGETERLSPASLVNTRPILTVIREFFGSSQLSQFMDQNNPLAELTHKRRLSALGPGGLSRDRASFDVRDVHYTQYGRMCPIETPEGPNIGLISYLTTYARIDDYGFIEAPYRRVDKETHQVSQDVVYLTADEEDKYIIAQANEPLDENDHFIRNKATVRRGSEFLEMPIENVDFMDVSPRMVVSVATSMIPFLENDDNTRALMGSNMQKQAVPLMVTESPIVGTGMEYPAAIDSGVVVCAQEAGEVIKVEADKVVIKTNEGFNHVYKLRKFKRTNQGTCFNQRPIVRVGEQVKVHDVIADGLATKDGEISLGKNALVGFMTWEGYNYEDAVLLNEKMVRDDIYTSLHVEVKSCEARDTKLGPEVISREIPNVSEDALKDLTAEGIVKIGTEVRSGDILVGKITPKGETELTPEERLLRAIFGEKAREVRDTSLKMQHGESGIVVDVRTFSHNMPDDHLPAGVNKVVRVYIAQKRKISVGDKMAGRHGNKGVVSRILPPEDMPFLPDGTPLDIVLNPLGVPSRMNIGQVLEVHLGLAAKKLGWKIMTPVFDGASEREILECMRMAGMYRDLFPLENAEGKELFEEVVDPETSEKTYRELTPEEHEDKEYVQSLRDKGSLKLCDGKTILYDGRTGEPFDNPVTVGIMYYLKLHHLVDDKIHARSNGPYSLVTQQPLGGKAQFGGQRFGEMEVWALEAYGAAYTLQEILTIKSDDILGRRKAYEAIIKGQNIQTPGTPESFKVLVKELQSLCLDIRILDKDGNDVALADVYGEEPSPYSGIRRPKLRPFEKEEELEDETVVYDADAAAEAGYGELDENGEYDDSSFDEDGEEDSFGEDEEMPYGDAEADELFGNDVDNDSEGL